jgi:hypothetical protein
MLTNWRKYIRIILIVAGLGLLAMLIKIKFIDPSFSEETELPQYTVVENNVAEIPDSTVVTMRLLLNEDASHKKIKGLLEKTQMKIKEGTYKYKAEPIIYLYIYNNPTQQGDNWVAMFSSRNGYKYK